MIRLLVPHVEQPLHESAQNLFSYEKLFSGQKSLHILGGKALYLIFISYIMFKSFILNFKGTNYDLKQYYQVTVFFQSHVV